MYSSNLHFLIPQSTIDFFPVIFCFLVTGICSLVRHRCVAFRSSATIVFGDAHHAATDSTVQVSDTTMSNACTSAGSQNLLYNSTASWYFSMISSSRRSLSFIF
jgi:hypothetical protein